MPARPEQNALDEPLGIHRAIAVASAPATSPSIGPGSLDAAVIATIVLLAADGPPVLNVEPHCRFVATRAAPIGDVESCLRVEEDAHQQLIKTWPDFRPAEKAHCLQLTRAGVEPTYTELLTCLELQRDARLLREQNERSAESQSK